jgi:hypothetical protein
LFVRVLNPSVRLSGNPAALSAAVLVHAGHRDALLTRLLEKQMAGAGGTDFPVNDEGWPLSPDGYEIIMEVGQVRALGLHGAGRGCAAAEARRYSECGANRALWQGWQRSGQTGRRAGLLAQRGSEGKENQAADG